MNPVLFLRYLKGYVSFTAEGGFAERFINLCTANNIVLWDTSYSGNILCSKCYTKNISDLRNTARKSGVFLQFQDSYGFYKDIRKQKQKVGLFAGVLFYIFFFSLMSCFVWTVEVSGNTSISNETILRMAETTGLSVGLFKPTFDEFGAANLLSQNYSDEIAWCAFNIKGSKAVIEIREQKKSVKDMSEKEPCNIISNSDGIILDFEIYEGVSDITVGNAVKKGDLLINGVSDNEDLSTLFVEADGKIAALTNRSFALSFSKTAKCRKITSTKSLYEMNIFMLRLPLIIKTNSYAFEHQENLIFNKIVLPVSLKIKTNYKTEATSRNSKEVLLSSLEKFSYEARNYNLNVLLLEENPTIFSYENEIIIENHWKTIAFIGKKQKISLES